MKVLLGLYSLFWIVLFHHAVVHSLKPPPYRADIDGGQRGSYPVQTFTSSKIRAPFVNFLQWHPDCDDGRYYFITPRGWKVSDPGPMILEGGDLIWFKHFSNRFGGQAYDLKVQSYKGEDYLTFWLGDDTIRGHGFGQYYMLNSSYDVVHEIGAVNGLHADLHDFVITPEGTGLLLTYENVQADVRPLGRKFNDLWNQAIWDCVFQEINIQTGDLIFEWRASEHLDLTLTYHNLDSTVGDSGTQANAFDWFHVNSIDKDEFGNYLVSARNLHAVLYIDGQSKDVIWTLGGKQNSFLDLSDGHALNFAWQHDARFVPVHTFPETYEPPPERDGFTTRLMTLFDNAAMDWKYLYGPSYSRVLLLEITFPTPGTKMPRTSRTEGSRLLTRQNSYQTQWQDVLSPKDQEKVKAINGSTSDDTVRVVREFVNPKHVISSTQGSVQLLGQGAGKDPKILAGYGINAVATEFSSNGSVYCDMHFGPVTSWETADVQSYRAFKFPWIGRPRQPPSVAVRNAHVWISWNGATECVEWILQASDELVNGGWKEIARVPRQGFETSISLPALEAKSSSRTLRVIALCRGGLLCENGVSEAVQRDGLLSWTGTKERLSNIRLGFWNSTILMICLIAASLFSTRVYRRLRSRRRRRFEGRFSSLQHID